MATKAYDENYAVEAITDSATGGLSIVYGHDAVGNVTTHGVHVTLRRTIA
jgi:hypothetical protein